MKIEQLLFATHNPWKALQFRPIFQAYGIVMQTLAAIQPERDGAFTESGSTALANALLKANNYRSENYPWVFGDDAGLEIDALHGEPGVQTRRWNGVFSDDVDDQTWLDYLLNRMKEVPLERRTACFVSGWALVGPDNCEFTHEIRWPFQIALEPIRAMSPGSPISAVRISPGDDLEHRRKQIMAEWKRWGILEKLTQDSPINKRET
jgi:inosine/xanthosine triphosphate pyrophosphatase family protein